MALTKSITKARDNLVINGGNLLNLSREKPNVLINSWKLAHY